MRLLMKTIVTILLTALCVGVAAAQDDPVETLPEEDVRRYTVEIIIFSYEEDVSVGTEVFVPDEPPVQDELLLDIDDPGAASAETDDPRAAAGIAASGAALLDDDSAGPVTRELELVLLTEEELTLDSIARQFELLDVYETIMHFGWEQPTYPQEETAPIELRVFGDPPEGLDGSFTLYLSRYLHLVVDLALDAEQAPAPSSDFDQPFYSDDPAYSFGDSRPVYDDDFGREVQPVRFRIQENRIVKNGELRYFDHPKFGVLAKIMRVEETEDDDADAALLGRTR